MCNCLNIAKGTTEPRVEFISQFLTQILIIFHLHNLQQVSTSKPNMNNWTSLLKLNFKILTTPSFRISTKIQLHSPYKTSAEKKWPNSCFNSCLNFNFKILTKPCAQSWNKSLAFWPNLSFQICNKLLTTRSSSLTSATVTTSTSFELASSHARVTPIKFTREQLGSQWVSDKGHSSY